LPSTFDWTGNFTQLNKYLQSIREKKDCNTEVSSTCFTFNALIQYRDEASLVHRKTATFVITVINTFVDKNNTCGKINANIVLI